MHADYLLAAQRMADAERRAVLYASRRRGRRSRRAHRLRRLRRWLVALARRADPLPPPADALPLTVDQRRDSSSSEVTMRPCA